MDEIDRLELLGAAKPDRDATFLRLLVDPPTGEDRQEAVLRRAVWDALGLDTAGRPWQVGRVFQPIGCQVDPALTRFFEVTGHVVATPSYPLQKLGFELAYRLATRGAWRVQPDLPSTAFAMEPDHEFEPNRRVIDEDGPHLPGTEVVTWALDKTGCRDAWKLPPAAGGAAKGAGSLIGQPDTGFTDHPELGDGALDLTRDWDVLDGDDDAHDPLRRRPGNPFDSPGHGTSTASVIVSREPRV
jgi:hypothetical protein